MLYMILLPALMHGAQVTLDGNLCVTVTQVTTDRIINSSVPD
jgi:hypothetical protein